MAQIQFVVAPEGDIPTEYTIVAGTPAQQAGFTDRTWSALPPGTTIEYPIPAGLPAGIYTFSIGFRADGCDTEACAFTTSFRILIDPEPALVCAGQINVNLREDCRTLLLPERVLSGSLACTDWSEYTLQVHDSLPDNEGWIDRCGEYIYEVFGPDGFSCWGYVRAQDKEAPRITCPDPAYGYEHEDGYREFLCQDIDQLLLTEVWQYTTDQYGMLLTVPEALGKVLDISGYPEVSDNCGDLLIEVWDEVQEVEEACSSQRIIRHFLVRDQCEELTAACSQEIFIGRPEFDDVLLPEATVEISCVEEIKLNEAGNPHPEVSGYPVLRTALGRYDINQAVCNIGAGYTDGERILVCEGTYKIVRKWQLVDWCRPEETFEYQQVIKVGDTEGPVVQCLEIDYDEDGEPDPLTFSTGPYDCTAAFEIPMPKISDHCSGWEVISEILIGDANGPVAALVPNGHSRYVSGVPLGCHLIRYTVTDDCGNQTVQYCPFLIEDQVAPIAVCNDDLHISIGDLGYARVSASEIDEGSSDNCGPIRLEVRRRIRDISQYDCLEVFDRDGNGVILNDEIRRSFELGDPDGDGAPDYDYYTEWLPYVEFTCCDMNENVRIELRVWDDRNQSGYAGDDSEWENCIDQEVLIRSDNSNSCWLDVLVEDKISPVCIPPLPANIDCSRLPFDFDPANSQQMIALFGAAAGQDNCPGWTVTELAPDTEQLTDCRWGSFVRYFQIFDNKQLESVSCEQVVTIAPVNAYRIRFPADTEAHCSTPEIDTISVWEEGCDLLAVSVKDEVFSAGGDECYKLFRTYSVINWCEYDGESDPVVVSRDEDCDGVPGDEDIWVVVKTIQEADPCYDYYDGEPAPYYSHVWYDSDGDPFNNVPLAGVKGTNCDYETNPLGFWKEVYPLTENEEEDKDNYPVPYDGEHCADMASVGYWQYTQVIKVYDDVSPLIKFDDQFPHCSYNTDEENGCPTAVSIAFSLQEECTPNDLSIVALLDVFADGLIDEDLSASVSGVYPDYTIGSTLPLGNHQIRLQVSDGCGNRSERRIPVEVVDCKAPAPICINGLAIELMPVLPVSDVDGDGHQDRGAMTIWASDFVAGPVTDCSGEVTYSINLAGRPSRVDQTSIILTCDSEPNTPIEIWAWDDTGYGDFCATYVFVQDNMVQCQAGTGALAGQFTSEEALPVEHVKVALSGEMLKAIASDADGNYSFQDLQNGFDYTITPSREDDPGNGVSTFDLVLMSKHILGVELLDSPYKRIAADINNDGRITAVDAITLRRIILNIDTEFFNNSSWRFIPQFYVFPDPENPWVVPFPEVININDLSGALTAQDFVAVKLGDLNSSAKVNAFDLQPRSVNGRYALRLDAIGLRAGETYRIDFHAADLEHIQGFQGTISFATDKVEFLDIQEGVATMENFGFRLLDEGLITTSWHRVGNQSADHMPEVAFSLELRAKTNTRLQDVIRMNSRVTAAEAYAMSGEILDLELNFDEVEQTHVFELDQNHPNPFRKETTIGFYLPSASKVDIRIHDAGGRLVKLIRGDYSAGRHHINVDQSQLNATGVLYYTLISGEYTATRKMIVLE